MSASGPLPAMLPVDPKRRKRMLALLWKYSWRCRWCGVAVLVSGCLDNDPRRATVDHVIPKAKGGDDRPSNRVLSCWACNQAKADKAPVEWTVGKPFARATVAANAALTLRKAGR